MALNQEIHIPILRHNSRGILSMASRPVKDRTAPGLQNSTGATANGSQFFITLAPQPHLDGESTVFGKVLNLTAADEGGDVLARLENAKAKVDKKGRVTQPPGGEEIAGEWEALRLNRVTIHANPFARWEANQQEREEKSETNAHHWKHVPFRPRQAVVGTHAL
jgi:cyclophilin family peptidyl-prolyl cis-trans isomerase